MIVCNNCGNELNNTAKFCRNCGTKVDPENVRVVDEKEAININQQAEEKIANVSASSNTAVKESDSSVDLDSIEARVFDYIDFVKETLIHPSSVFRGENDTRIFGAVSTVVYAIVLGLNRAEPFMTSFITYVLYQALFVGMLFLLNKFLLGGNDTYFDALGKYGGLIHGQIILFLVIWFVGVVNGFGYFLFFAAVINQLNIFNLYIFNSQKNGRAKFDRYYQLLVSYIPLMVIIYYMFIVMI